MVLTVNSHRKNIGLYSLLLIAFSVTAVAQKAELVVQTGHSFFVKSVAFSPDGKTLASGSDDDTIKIWDVATGKELRTLSGHTSVVNSVAFSPDGKTLASGSGDGTIKLWEVESGKTVQTFTGHTLLVNSVRREAAGT